MGRAQTAIAAGERADPAEIVAIHPDQAFPPSAHVEESVADGSEAERAAIRTNGPVEDLLRANGQRPGSVRGNE